MNRADHIIESCEVRSPSYTEQDSAEQRPNKAFYGLLRAECDQRRAAHGDTADVCEDIVADDQEGGNPEPDKAFEDVVDDEVAKKNINKCDLI